MVKLPKVSVFIATSLDGFIARKDGSIDWLERANSTVPPSEDCGYQNFFYSTDTLVMGRNTFEKVLTFKTWPYGIKRVVVQSTLLLGQFLKKWLGRSYQHEVTAETQRSGSFGHSPLT